MFVPLTNGDELILTTLLLGILIIANIYDIHKIARIIKLLIFQLWLKNDFPQPKRLANNLWVYARTTLENRFKTFVFPVIAYYCVVLVTALEHLIKKLELLQTRHSGSSLVR
ncbi:hypothetical protein CEXT_451711 [Caerostris extrusa]|uniref:Uncharacterized protein n=1 Tax=Caerostris extrusa TaxID=172846 RepID=A0AAV4UXP7_CAEEX|nr:hypothetical protein CEXT_451711 [Caerostris extrusa]